MSYLYLGARAPLPVNQIGVKLRTIKTKFAAQRRARPSAFFRLRPPPIVNAPVLNLFGVVNTSLARQSRGKTASRLRPPPIANAPVLNLFGLVSVTLAPQSRGRPSSRLRLPVVVGAAIPPSPPVVTTLRKTFAQRRRIYLGSGLWRPTFIVVNQTVAFGYVAIWLAPQRPQSRTTYKLRPPVV